MTNTVQYRDPSDTSRGPSPVIWGTCPWANIRDQVNEGAGGYAFWEDFDSGGLITSPTTIAALGGGMRMSGFGSTGATIAYDDAAAGSSGLVLTEATDNEAVSIFTENHPFVLSDVAGSLWFEARVKFSTITTNEQAWFVGLADATAFTAAIPLTATGTLADINLVGFHKQEANTTKFDTSYKANGITAVEVNSDVGVLVVDTYVKLGFTMLQTDHKLRFYIDGAEQAATKTIANALGTDTPSDVGLGVAVGQLLANSAAETTTVDWLRCAQLAA